MWAQQNLETAPAAANLWQRSDPEQRKQLFWILPAGLGAVLFLLAFFRGRGDQSSFFQNREFERKKDPRASGSDSMAQAKMKRPAQPLQLTGIRIDGAAHEILGVAPTATEPEIQNAFKELMKRYHPDRVARPGTPQWQEASKIAQSIQSAREELVQALRKAGNRR